MPIKVNPDIKKFIDWWCQHFAKKSGEKYHVLGGKEGKLVKELLYTHPYDELVEFGKKFFRSQDKFIKDSPYTIGVFSSVINKLAIQKEEEDEWE